MVINYSLSRISVRNIILLTKLKTIQSVSHASDYMTQSCSGLFSFSKGLNSKIKRSKEQKLQYNSPEFHFFAFDAFRFFELVFSGQYFPSNPARKLFISDCRFVWRFIIMAAKSLSFPCNPSSCALFSASTASLFALINKINY